MVTATTEQIKSWEGDIRILKIFLKQKPWRKTKDQKDKWEEFNVVMGVSNDVKAPTLRLNRNNPTPTYNPQTQTITLTKYSIISYLHEFGHHLGYDEAKCKLFSETVFKQAYKPSRKLVRDSRGYLVKPKMESD